MQSGYGRRVESRVVVRFHPPLSGKQQLDQLARHLPTQIQMILGCNLNRYRLAGAQVEHRVFRRPLNRLASRNRCVPITPCDRCDQEG